jgi:hypothetical protein
MARVAVEIGFFYQDTLKGFNNAITSMCKDYPANCTSSLHKSNYFYSNPPAYIDNKINYEGYIKCSQSYYKNCNFLAENLLDLTIGQSIANANSLDGCESDIRSSINACGACGVSCIDAPDENQCSAYLLNKEGGKSACAYSCTNGACSAKSLSPGQCSLHSIGISAECLSKNCIDSNSINNLDNNRMWCCQRANDCSYNGACYSNNQAMPQTINGKYYYCSNTQWLEISPKLNLSRMIDYNHDLNTLSNAYFSDLGISNSCSNSNFNACEKSASYTFKYCFGYNIVFDGMFSIESDSNVPILVSEQELYNPYLKSSPIISPINECTVGSGTDEGVMYCAK